LLKRLGEVVGGQREEGDELDDVVHSPEQSGVAKIENAEEQIESLHHSQSCRYCLSHSICNRRTCLNFEWMAPYKFVVKRSSVDRGEVCLCERNCEILKLVSVYLIESCKLETNMLRIKPLV